MDILDVISFIGFPTLCAFGGYLLARVKSYHNITIAVQNGVQALLRDRLLNSYYYCSKEGHATVEDRENWEHMYVQYKALGGNGVIENIRENFMDLPID